MGLGFSDIRSFSQAQAFSLVFYFYLRIEVNFTIFRC